MTPRQPGPGADAAPWHSLLPGATTRRGRVVAAGYCGLCLVPPLAAAWFDAVRPWWFLSTLALAVIVLWLYERRGTARAAALGIGALAVLANLLLLASFYVQGTGFNAQFFYHLEPETFLVAWRAFLAESVVVGAYWLFVALWPCLLPERPGGAPAARGWLRAAAVAVAVAAALNAALLSAAWHVGTGLVRAHRIVLVPKPRNPVIDAVDAATRRDLVVVVAESLEATYARADLLGADLTPRLTALATDAVRFTDVRQVSHTGWTTGALVAASCALPMPPADFWRVWPTGTIDARMPDAVCLGDVLAAHGYRTIFFGGAPLWFAGKGGFLAAHGFAERYGYDELAPQLRDPAYLSGWGVHDDELLALARDKLAELVAADGPFALVVLTLDTHFPPGYPSASCQPGNGRRDRAATIRCADRLIADFIADVRRTAPDAVVVLYSDHLSQESPRRAGLLAEGGALRSGLDGSHGILGLVDSRRDPGPRRLRFAIWDRDVAPFAVDRPGTHFDIMPTVLDALGFARWREHAFGASLLRTGSPWLAHPDPDALQIVHDLAGLVLPPDGLVTFDPQGLMIEIDGQRVLATGRGLALRDAVFAIGFGPDGHAGNILDAQGLEALLAGSGPPTLVVGISSSPAVNGRLLPDDAPALAYFAGRPGQDLRAGMLSESTGQRTVRIRP